MKNHILSILVISFLCTNVLSGQNYLKLFKSQDYSQISKVFSQDVKVKIDRNTRVSGRDEGIAELKSFLRKFKPVKIESKHKGSNSNGDSNYVVGKLFNAKNEGVRFFINLENGQSGRVICDLKVKSL